MGKTFKDKLVSKFGGPAKFPDDIDANYPVNDHSIVESFEIDAVLQPAVKADPLTPVFRILREQTDVLLKTGGKKVLKPDDLPTEDDMVDDGFDINVDLSGLDHD